MYENEYFFICRPKESPQLPALKPDKNTEQRHFRFEALPLGQAPLKFYNSWKEENRAEGVRTITPDILFDGANLMVHDKIRERLLDIETPKLHIYPSIYVDDDDRWHEDFWYLTFTERFDCWDRRTSNYGQDGPPVRLGGFEYFQVYNYSFNSDLMKNTPLEQRLIFEMGGTLDPYVTVHESIIGKVFGSPGANGADYIRVSDY